MALYSLNLVGESLTNRKSTPSEAPRFASQEAEGQAVPKAERSPLPLYYLAYFASLQANHKSAKAYLNQAAKTYGDYAFPSRPEAVEVFKYAITENPDDAYAHLHLGNLYGNFGRLDEARSHWQRAGELDPSLSITFRNLGLYAWAVENDLTKAEEFYRKAIAARPKDQTLYRDSADILLAANIMLTAL